MGEDLLESSFTNFVTNGSKGLGAISPMSVNVSSAETQAPGLMDAPIPSPAPSEGGLNPETPVGRRIAKHHSSDNSAAGGDVILGGFATALVAVIYCYIRVTRKNQDAHVND
ncbi:hypothetical protein F0562_018951 [Nyssa sinensis]|uniref:Uncharacterized protein n=1 Tax=Nyssa sinensis TaxID=561372 RepID=A0A5J4ZCY6_9ASTE|nr:hypothetical protein F0562_018951 [Nyssa sinensis]